MWDDASADKMMPCLPIVGIAVGAAWWGAAELLAISGIHTALAAALLMLVPYIIAGLIHLDGYMDTSDAILSRRTLEEKLRILKDPHTGSFAVIMIAVLFILQFAAAFAIVGDVKPLALLVVIPIISRCGSAASVLCLKPLTREGYVNMFRPEKGALHKVFVFAIAAAAVYLSFMIAGYQGLIVASAGILGYVAAMAYAYSGFKGISGDLAGFSLVVSELCGFVALAVV